MYDSVQSAQYYYIYNIQYKPCKLNPFKYDCIKPVKPIKFKDIPKEVEKLEKSRKELLKTKREYDDCLSTSYTSLTCGKDPGTFDSEILDNYKNLIKSNMYYGKYY